MSLLDSLRPKSSLGREWLIEPPPTFPFLKSQCQTARRATIFTSKLNGNTALRDKPRSSVGAGYRCGVPACQTLKSPKKRFFSGACGSPLGTQSRTRARLYIGAVFRDATAGGRRRAAQQSRPGNKGFPDHGATEITGRTPRDIDQRSRKTNQATDLQEENSNSARTRRSPLPSKTRGRPSRAP